MGPLPSPYTSYDKYRQHYTVSHQAFLSLPQQGTQHKLQPVYSNCLHTHLLSLVEPRRSIKIMLAAGPGASALLHVPEFFPGCSMSNREFELAVKLCLGATILPNLPSTCACGAHIDSTGDHLETHSIESVHLSYSSLSRPSSHQ